MSGVIYLVGDDGGLQTMAESSYDSEDRLQRLLADHADLLAGEQINVAAPRRWLLLAREAPVPDAEGGAGRWSVDHLFVDQDGVPTIVEVKRSSDNRIRREVVGQMLDYAANAVVYWPVEHLRAQYEAACDARGVEPEREIAQALEVEDAEGLWQAVKTNLQAGRVRMVFVADSIPSELRRVIEFLNVQMNPAEVLGVEIKQYVGPSQRALVPRVIGQTQQAVAQKSSGAAKREIWQWDANSWLELLRGSGVPGVEATWRAVQAWTEERGLAETWGRGKTGPFYPTLVLGSAHVRLFAMQSTGTFNVDFNVLGATSPFSRDDARVLLLDRINVALGYSATPTSAQWEAASINTNRFIGFDVLSQPPVLSAFLGAFDWAIREMRSNSDGGTPCDA